MKTPPPPWPLPPPTGWWRWAPGVHVLFNYQRDWLASDIVAGLVLSAILVPVGMGYAEAAGRIRPWPPSSPA